jgi:hypothetical protein
MVFVYNVLPSFFWAKRGEKKLMAGVLFCVSRLFIIQGEIEGGRKLYDCFVSEKDSYLPRCLSSVPFVLRIKAKRLKRSCHFFSSD